MTKDNDNLLDEIIDEASKLPIEKQEYVLAVIRGMVFTGKCYKKQDDDIVLSEKSPF